MKSLDSTTAWGSAKSVLQKCTTQIKQSRLQLDYVANVVWHSLLRGKSRRVQGYGVAEYLTAVVLAHVKVCL